MVSSTVTLLMFIIGGPLLIWVAFTLWWTLGQKKSMTMPLVSLGCLMFAFILFFASKYSEYRDMAKASAEDFKRLQALQGEPRLPVMSQQPQLPSYQQIVSSPQPQLPTMPQPPSYQQTVSLPQLPGQM